MNTNRYQLGQLWKSIQRSLFPELEDMVGELSEKDRNFIKTCELCADAMEKEMAAYERKHMGRPPAERMAIAKAFIAKAVYGMPTTEGLIAYLNASPTLRRLCGWESVGALPSEPTFSRVFKVFAESKLPGRIHKAMVKKAYARKLVGHISRDATAIEARERAQKTEVVEDFKPVPRKKGRPRRDEQREEAPRKRLELQGGRTLEENLADLPSVCNWGCKRDSNGKKKAWKGYKLHVDIADGDIPISAVLTSASLHDSQTAIPLAQMSAQRVTNCYDLMDAAYDAEEIREHSRSLNHVPIIDLNRRGGEKLPMAPAQAQRYNQRSSSERGFSYLEHYGAYSIWVKGAVKVMCHLMFAVLALTAHQMFNMLL
jgi:transposase